MFYISPKCNKTTFTQTISQIQKQLNQNLPFVLIGDTNLKLDNLSDVNHIKFIEKTLNCKQFMSDITTDQQSTLDHIYSNCHNLNVGTYDNPWSDHKIIYAELQ